MKKKFRSIKNRLFIILLALSLGSLVLMSAIAFYSMNEIKKNTMEIMLNKHKHMLEMTVHKQAEVTEEIITRIEQAITILSESIFWSKENNNAINKVLISMKNNNPYIYNTFIAYPNGVAHFYSKNPNFKLKDGYDSREKNWYKNSITTKKFVWSEVYRESLSEKLMITCSHVIYTSDSTIAAVIGIDLTIDAINNRIINSDKKKIGYTFLIDSSGNLIARPEFNKSDKRWDEIFSMPLGNPLDSLGDKNNREPIEVLIDIKKEMITKTKGFKKWIRNGPSKYIAFETIIGKKVLGVVLSEEFIQREIKDSFTRQFKNITFYFLFSLIIVTFIVILVGMKLSQKITKPISALNKGAKRIGSGDLDYDIQIDTNDELEALADEFKKMSIDLKHYIKDLEETTKLKQKMESELNIASRIQMDMLPLIFPPFPDKGEIDIFASMTPAKQVGGDFYDFFFINENKLCFVIGDVSGKGIPAALFMVISKTLIKNEAMSGVSPAEVLDKVNRTLIEGNDEMMFVTVLVCMLDITTGELTIANGGHNPPLLAQNGNDFDYISLNKGRAIGVFDDGTFSNQTISLKKGDTCFLYTDGVNEAMNNENQQFSEERLYKTLIGQNKKSVEDIKEKVLYDVKCFVEGADQSDDITTLVVRYNAS